VNASIGAVAVLVIEPVFVPPSEAGELRPEPEFCAANKDNVALGLSAVEPSKVTSGYTFCINANL
tara:strand:- start:27 stop:221 length:195 start_codon:yes stop_codon:yes gene_type:complete